MVINDHDGDVEVTMPWKRAELIVLLRELCDREKQFRLWIMHEDFPSTSGIDEIFHFFFDDNDLGNDPNSEVGRILKNTNEVNVISRVSSALNELEQRLGDADSCAFMSDAAWPSMIILASEALKVLAKD